MKTFTVPVFLCVNAETKQEAIEKALAFMEYALDTGNDEGTFPYCDIGNLNEVIDEGLYRWARSAGVKI